jgi:alkyl hydroperoxide reductase subunit AhpC
MALQLGNIAPDFNAVTTEGEINFHKYLGDGWGVLFSHPADYTPVCTTELGRVAQLKGEFDKRNVKVLALSVDPLQEHKDWIKDINETQNTTMNYPIIADDGKIAQLYGMLHPDAADKVPVRSVFVVGPDKKVKLTITYPPSTGRNFDCKASHLRSVQVVSKAQIRSSGTGKVDARRNDAR